MKTLNITFKNELEAKEFMDWYAQSGTDQYSDHLEIQEKEISSRISIFDTVNLKMSIGM